MTLKAFGEAPATDGIETEWAAFCRVLVLEDGVPVGQGIWVNYTYGSADTADSIRLALQADWVARFNARESRTDGDTATFVWLDGWQPPAE